MRLFYAFTLFPFVVAHTFNPRQNGTTPDNVDLSCSLPCQEVAMRDIAASGCGDDPLCLCQDSKYRSNIEMCLKQRCPEEFAQDVLAGINEACDEAATMMTSPASPTATFISPSTAIGSVSRTLGSISSAITSVTSSARSVTQSTTPAIGSPRSSTSSIVSAQSGPSSSSSAWAIPTAFPKVMGVAAAAVGAMIIA